MTLKGDFLGVEDFSGAVKVPWEWIEKGLKDEGVSPCELMLSVASDICHEAAIAKNNHSSLVIVDS